MINSPNISYKSISSNTMQLGTDQKVKLINELANSIKGVGEVDYSDKILEILDRRLDNYMKNPESGFSEEEVMAELEEIIKKSISTGTFGADMQVELVNDGPVTIYMDSQSPE